jgi:hypothetical protein
MWPVASTVLAALSIALHADTPPASAPSATDIRSLITGGPDDSATWGGLYVLKDGRGLGLIGLHGRVWCRFNSAGL